VTDPDAELPSWDFRRRTITASEALLRILNKAVSTYGSDLDIFVVFLTVTCASTSSAVRNAELAAEPPAGHVPVGYYRGISRRAIAASTGLPRETVRRKIAALIERGDVVEHGAYVRIRQGLLEQEHHLGFARTMIHEFVRGAAELSRIPQ